MDMNRRVFVKITAAALPIAGCTPETPPEDALSKTLHKTKANLTDEQLRQARQYEQQFQGALEVVRKADVPYVVEPRFYPGEI